MDGLALVGELSSRATAEALPMPECIILSGYTEFEYARSALRLGVGEYLLKPVDDADLRAALLRARDRIFARSERAKAEKSLFREYSPGEDGAARDGYVGLAIRILKERYIQGVTIEEAASELGISAGHLSRTFRQETGYTFVDYLMYVRVKRAAELLRNPTVKIYEVADLVGYADARYFGQVFRKVTGMTPKEFRDDMGRTDSPIAQG
jgi:two-component system response regulator YesN